ncbi:MAG: diacylglycerol kinase family lipid kinase [candidate division KSB1 bacterium]|nr:diacylglycerol kinase family lipid kinase [candidate division KSB1 bacterium]MDZ7301729.1 diacylglycerol kinase family lipid kinase [candidate division KSB1 bacterium]MDZ7311492.1 diacylglycerol kinase family lipid kinase [candidate division KSB1 bacterium]
MRSGKIKFIINPIAGFRRDKRYIYNLIRRRCKGMNFKIEHTYAPGDATRVAQKAAAEGYTTVVAVGGDGTVNETASGLVGTDTALGIMPRGSGNGLARSLGIPLQPAEALELICTGKEHYIDAGRAAHRYFFVVTGVGFDAYVGHKFNTAMWRGPLPYFYIVAREFVNYHPEPLRLHLEQEVMEMTPFLVTIANTLQYGNGAIIAPHAKPDDGILEVCVVRPMTFAELILHAPKLFNGKADTVPLITYFRSKKAAIEKCGPVLFHVDGEAQICESPIEISVLPRALKVIVPPSYVS